MAQQIGRHALQGAIILTITLCINACATIPPRTRESTPPKADATVLLKALRSKSFILSNDDRTSATQFDIRLRWSGHLPDGNPFAYDCMVARNGDNVAIVLLSADGLPFCYMANNVLLKAESGGRWVALTQGSPVVTFERIAGQDRFQVFTAFLKTPNSSNVRVDLSSIIEGIALKATQVTLDADGRVIRIKTERAEASIGLLPSGRDDAFPLKSLRVRSANGSSAAADSLHLGSSTSIPFDLTLADVGRAGIEVQQADPATFQEMQLLLPADFATDIRSRQTAAALSRLLRLSLPSSGLKMGTDPS